MDVRPVRLVILPDRRGMRVPGRDQVVALVGNLIDVFRRAADLAVAQGEVRVADREQGTCA
jgi:hypothetical protein